MIKTHVIDLDNQKYLIVFPQSLFNNISKEEINESKNIAKNLNIDPNFNVIYDLFLKNGHANYVYNRLYIVDNSCQYKFKDLGNLNILSNNKKLEILKRCNMWWIANYDFSNSYTVGERSISILLNNNNLKIKWF